MKLLTNRWTHIVLLLLLLAGAVYFSGSEAEIRKRLQYATFDTFNRLFPREASDKIVIVDLDEASLKHMGQWPWPRTKLAELILILKDLGAKVTAFDIVFAEADRTSPKMIANGFPDDETYAAVKADLSIMPDNDLVFANAIAQADNIVTGFTRARPEETLRRPVQVSKPTFLVKNKQPFFEDTYPAAGVATNLPMFESAAAGNGSFMATPDVDGIIRQVSVFVRYPPDSTDLVKSEIYPMLGLEALRVAINKDARLLVKDRKDRGALDTEYLIRIADFEIPIESDSKIWVYYRDIKDSEYVSAYKLFDPVEREKIKDRIKDKIVFIGTSAEGLRDIRSTPLDIFIPGVEVHVNMVEQILQGKYLKRPDIIVGVEAMIIACAGVLIVILTPFINVIWLAFFTAGLIGTMFYGAWQAFLGYGVLLDPVYPSVVLSGLFLMSALLSYIRSEADRQQIRSAFGLYVSPDFMAELTKNPDKLKLGGEVRDLTVMFTDIRSFTTISESLTPEELIQLMNDFLTPMSDLVMNNRGTIDKYMGDAMMAFWNAPLDDPDHARNACRVALKMNEALIPINERVKAKADSEGRIPTLLNAGIGINTGPCSVGNMGSKQRFAYSALGDAVNLASRLESQTKAYGVNILLGEETQKHIPDMAALELDLLQVKGKNKPVRIFTLVGDEKTAQEDHFKKWQTAHNAMLAAYRIADFQCAAQDIREAREASMGQIPGFYDMFADRIASLIKNPPQGHWDGVFVAKDK